MLQKALRDAFRDLLSMEGVWGVMFLSPSGSVVFEEFSAAWGAPAAAAQCLRLLETLEGERETELLFEKASVNVRRSKKGTLVVVTERRVPSAMVRLNTDIGLATLDAGKPAKGIMRFFRR